MTPFEWIMLASLATNLIGGAGKGMASRKEKLRLAEDEKKNTEFDAKEARKAALSRAVSYNMIPGQKYESQFKPTDYTPYETLQGLGSTGAQLSSYYGAKPRLG